MKVTYAYAVSVGIMGRAMHIYKMADITVVYTKMRLVLMLVLHPVTNLLM